MPLSLLIWVFGAERIQSEWNFFQTAPLLLWVAMLALVPLNLFLEYYKLKKCLTFSGISLPNSQFIAAFFRGLSLRFVFPNKMGLAASIAVKTGYKGAKTLLLPLAINNLSQLACTLVLGGVGLIFYYKELGSLFSFKTNAWVLVLLLGALLATYFYLKTKHKGFKSSFKRIELKKLTTFLLSYSLLRYLVFTFQFALCANHFLPQIGLGQHFIILPIVFLLTSIIPLGFAGNLGARESVAFGIYAMIFGEVQGIVSASLLLWIVNLLLPAVLGLLVMFKTEILNPKEVNV